MTAPSATVPLREATHERRASRLCMLALALLPLVLLWPCVFGGRTFVPYDLATQPPRSFALTPEQLAAARDGANFDVTEVPIWFAPELQLARQQLLAGEWPVWNPWARGGTPLHAHGLLGLCYPPNWIALAAEDPSTRLVWLAWTSLAIAGLLTFGLLRALALPPLPALFGAALFALSGTLCANAHFWMRLASLVWLPGMLWAALAIDRVQGHARWRPVAGLALTIAASWLAGFPPFAVASTIVTAAFAAMLVARRWRSEGRLAAQQLGLALLAGAGLGLSLAMPQVLPSLEFFPHSARQTPTAQMLSENRFDLYGLLGYLAPDLFGHPTRAAELPYGQSPLCLWLGTLTNATGGPRTPNYNYTEYSVTVGGLGLLLAVFGAVCGRGRLRWAAIALFAMLLGLATFAPGFRLLAQAPGFAQVWPFRWLAPGALFVAWLAALGCERLLAAPRRAAPALAAIAFAFWVAVPWLASRPLTEYSAQPTAMAARIAERFAPMLRDNPSVTAEQATQKVVAYVNEGAAVDRFFAAFGHASLAGMRSGTWFLAAGLALLLLALCERRRALHRALPLASIGLVAVAVTELALHGRALDSGVVRADAAPTPVHEFLAQQRDRAADRGGFTIARASRTPTLPAQLPPGELLLHGVRDLHFDTHFDGHSHEPLRRLFGDATAANGNLTRTLVDAVHENDVKSPPPHALESPLLDLYGVRYLLATEPLEHAGARVGPELRGNGGEFFVYERPHALPRAFVVPEVAVLADDAAVLQALLAPELQPARRALLTKADADGLSPLAPTAPDAPPRRVRFVADHPDEVVLDVGAGAPGLLVLADTHLPGWTATVDGIEVPIRRANHWQRALPVPAAACTVRFRYRAPGLAAGALLSAIATVALAWLWLRARRSSAVRAPVDTAV